MSVNRLIENFKPEKYDLKLDLSRADQRQFSGLVKIYGQRLDPEIIKLHAKDLEIESVFLDGEELEFEEFYDDELMIFAPDSSFDSSSNVELEIEFSGEITDAMHGLYPCYYQENGAPKELFATQFESHHAREVFPCVDEPEAKAIFELELTAIKNLNFISNTPEVSRVENGDLAMVKFAPTPKMSSYLLAFVVGDLQKKTAFTKSGVEVSAWATKAQSPELLDFPLDIAVRVLDFYEEYFDEKFPLPKCDHVALPDFSSGAMENWGLITYRETAMLAGEKSAISARKYVALVIAHETAHQWFGNLVTMRWWDELWLNESFATMMEYFAVDNIEPSWNIWQEFAVNEAVMSLRRDAIDGVQSVQIPVHHPSEISTIFDGAIVYAKGARLMNMLREFVGDQAFRDGLRQYFKRHKYQNTEGDDLWSCLSQASGKDVASFMKPWIAQPGYPSVSASTEGDELNLRQKQFFVGCGCDKHRLWPIYLRSNQPNLPQIMSEESVSAQLSEELVRLNQGDISHFIANYSPALLKKLLVKIPELDTISRLQILQERSLLARGGEISSGDLVEVLRFYSHETEFNVWDMMSIMIGDLKIFADEEIKPLLQKFIADLAKNQFEKLGFCKKQLESEDETQLRASILAHMIYAEDELAIEQALEIFNQNQAEIEKIDAEIRGVVLSAKVKFDSSPELIDQLFEKYQNTPNVDLRSDLLAALASTQQAETAKIFLEAILTRKIRPQDIVSWFVHLLRNDKTREITWGWLRQNWDWLEETFDGDKSYNDFPRYAGSILRTEQQLAEFKEFFLPKKIDPSLTRSIEMGEKEIAARIELIARDKQTVRQALEN